MLLPGTQPLPSKLPLLLLKTDIQTRRKERERAAGAPGPLPACSQGPPPGDSDPAPSASTLHFTPGAKLRDRTPDLLQFFLKTRRWEGENDQRWRCPKAAALKWRVEGVAPTPPRGSPGPLRGAASYLFSL